MPKYNHAEAFCIMEYEADDGSEREFIWNSRDGVTPFVLTLRSGKAAKHVNWRADVCYPAYKPLPGTRIFIDLAIDKAREYAKERVEKYPEYAPKGNKKRKIFVENLAQDMWHNGEAPDLVEVDSNGQY